MTDRCEPPEGIRDQDGLHWVRTGRPGDTEDEVAEWHASERKWLLPGYPEPHSTEFLDRDNGGIIYLAPVATPAEVDALRAERDDIRAKAAHHDRRVTELLDANNREVERRRVAEANADRLRAAQRRALEIAIAPDHGRPREILTWCIANIAESIQERDND